MEVAAQSGGEGNGTGGGDDGDLVIAVAMGPTQFQGAPPGRFSGRRTGAA